MYLLKIRLCILLLFLNLSGYAQLEKDTIETLPEVVINGDRLQNFSSGSKIQKIDPLAIRNLTSNNLGDLLSQQTSLFVKSYGFNQISSISSRGTNANHTAILWNGFNIQGPTLGQSDFSTVPITFLDEVDVQYGSASALFGSGALGGVIHLNNTTMFNQGHTVGLASYVGSYGNVHGGLNYEFSKKQYVCKIKYFNKYGQNNYPLSKASGKRLENSEVKQSGLLVENYFKLSDSQQINLRVWLQDLLREIPGNNSFHNTTNQNKFCRISSEWKRLGAANTYFIRTAYFNELYDYREQNSFKTIFQTVINEAESKIKIKSNQTLNIGLNNTYHEAKSLAYDGIKSQNRSAIFTSYKLNNSLNSVSLTTTIRQEIASNKWVPLIPSLGSQVTVTRNILVRAQIAKSYRLPSFNDLYWSHNGNMNLRPELGWSEEIGIQGNKTTGSLGHQVDATVFNSNITNWIIWLPKSGRWTPQNIQEVWSRGFESSYKINAELNNVKINFALDYSYTLSTNTKATSLNDASKNKQLIYVPIYQGGARLNLEYKTYAVSYVHTSIGNRFTSSANTEYIKGYQIANVTLNKKFNISKVIGNLNFQVNNIFNVEYQVVLARPMPLRNYQLGLSFYFNKPNNPF